MCNRTNVWYEHKHLFHGVFLKIDFWNIFYVIKFIQQKHNKHLCINSQSCTLITHIPFQSISLRRRTSNAVCCYVELPFLSSGHHWTNIISWSLPFLECQELRRIWYVFFSVFLYSTWFFWHSALFLNTFFNVFTSVECSTMWVYHSLFIHSSDERHLCSF